MRKIWNGQNGRGMIRPVIYMGLVNLENPESFVEAGRKGTTPAVLIENATLPEQREIYAPFGRTAQGSDGCWDQRSVDHYRWRSGRCAQPSRDQASAAS